MKGIEKSLATVFTTEIGGGTIIGGNNSTFGVCHAECVCTEVIVTSFIDVLVPGISFALTGKFFLCSAVHGARSSTGVIATSAEWLPCCY